MSTLIQLRSRLENMVKDSTIQDSDYNARLNEAVQAIAGGINLPQISSTYITQPLEALLTYGQVNTVLDQNRAPMPTDYMERRDGLLHIYCSVCGRYIPIAHTIHELFAQDRSRAQNGVVDRAMAIGSEFHYARIPESVTAFDIDYYRSPVDMVNDTDTPDGIPVIWQYRLLTTYAAWRIYAEEIEIGEVGEGLQTAHFRELFYQSMLEFDNTIQPQNDNLTISPWTSNSAHGCGASSSGGGGGCCG